MVEVRCGELGSCPRCGGDLVLTGDFPDPASPGGRRRVELCVRCDADNPRAHDLVAFLTEHDQISADQLDEYAGLLRAWIEDTRTPTLSDAEIHQAITRWSNGAGPVV